MNNYRKDALYLLCLGFADGAFKIMEDTDSELHKLIKAVHKQSPKKIKVAFQESKIAINKELELITPILDELEQFSLEVMLVLTMQYLVVEAKHTTARIHFLHFDYDKVVEWLESSKYRDFIFEHQKCLSKVVVEG